MRHGFFVTGTDTGVGKTLVSAALVHHFAQQGLKSAGMKPVAAGCRIENGVLRCDDVVQLQQASNVELPPENINPYAFEPPLAPHVAADMAGTHIEMDFIHAAFKKAAAAVDILVVEGVGGFRVPLNDTEDTADLARVLGLPVILVVGLRLGCLNHALLTAEAVAARGLRLAAWVANGIDPGMAAQQENLQALQQRIAAPCLGVVSFQQRPGFRATEAMLAAAEMRNLVCA